MSAKDQAIAVSQNDGHTAVATFLAQVEAEHGEGRNSRGDEL
jgi:hypothetical protein